MLLNIIYLIFGIFYTGIAILGTERYKGWRIFWAILGISNLLVLIPGASLYLFGMWIGCFAVWGIVWLSKFTLTSKGVLQFLLVIAIVLSLSSCNSMEGDGRQESTHIVHKHATDIVNGNSYYYLISKDGHKLSVGFTDYILIEDGQEITGQWYK